MHIDRDRHLIITLKLMQSFIKKYFFYLSVYTVKYCIKDISIRIFLKLEQDEET